MPERPSSGEVGIQNATIPLGPVTRALLVINVGVFLFAMLYEGDSLSRNQFVYGHFALSVSGLKGLQLWQLVTYQFMHGGWWHLIFNGMGLYFGGRIMEVILGRVTYLSLYLVGGIIGGLIQMLAFATFDTGSGTVVGASASVLALMGAFCCVFWNQRLPLNLMFVPVTLSGRSLLFLLALFDGIGLVWPQGNIGHHAHLGGLFTGFLAMKFVIHRGTKRSRTKRSTS